MIEASKNALVVRFWGVRGSHSVSGPSYEAYGGNTPCVEFRLGERLFIVDAGTGIIPLGKAIVGAPPQTIDILFSHLHLDHVTGLSFFAPAFLKDRTIRTFCGNLDGRSAEAALDQLYSPPLFPVGLDAFPATFEHHGFRSGEALAFDGGITIRTLPIRHPSGATAYRFDHGGRSVCFVSDIEHEDPWPPDALVAFIRKADLVIFDAMYSAREYCRCRGWGHSTLEAGIALCDAAGVKDFAAFHHNPAHDDAALAAREAELKAMRRNAFFARDGMTLVYEPRAGKG